jgi:hypothetical protein
MFFQLHGQAAPPNLRSPLLVDDRGLPRYWATIWSTLMTRAVARLHPSPAAASSITRHPARMALLSKYQALQDEFRRWRGRVPRMSGTDRAAALAAKDARIAELEAAVQLLTASHVAMLRAVGELGGFSKWTKFYGDYSSPNGWGPACRRYE